MEIKSKQQILQRRKEIEQELVDWLQETGSEFGLEDIKEIIYNIITIFYKVNLDNKFMIVYCG